LINYIQTKELELNIFELYCLINSDNNSQLLFLNKPFAFKLGWYIIKKEELEALNLA
jgi:hypothetical protein